MLTRELQRSILQLAIGDESWPLCEQLSIFFLFLLATSWSNLTVVIKSAYFNISCCDSLVKNQYSPLAKAILSFLSRLLLDNEKYYLDKDNDKIKIEILLLLGKICCQNNYLLDKVSRYFIQIIIVCLLLLFQGLMSYCLAVVSTLVLALNKNKN